MLQNILKLEGISFIEKKQQKTITGGKGDELQFVCEPDIPLGCLNPIKAYNNSDLLGQGSTCYTWVCEGSGDTGPGSPHNQ